PAARRDLARVRGLSAGEDAEQRRLAAAVRPDDPHAGARLDGEVETGEDQPRAEALRDTARLEQRHAPRLDPARATVVVRADDLRSAVGAMSQGPSPGHGR